MVALRENLNCGCVYVEQQYEKKIGKASNRTCEKPQSLQRCLLFLIRARWDIEGQLEFAAILRSN